MRPQSLDVVPEIVLGDLPVRDALNLLEDDRIVPEDDGTPLLGYVQSRRMAAQRSKSLRRAAGLYHSITIRSAPAS